MPGWIGLALAFAAIIALFIIDPVSAMNFELPVEPQLAYAALLLCIAALASALGLMSPSHSVSRQAALWGAVAAGVVTVAVNMDTLGGSLMSLSSKAAANHNVERAGNDDDGARRYSERTRSVFGETEHEYGEEGVEE